MRSQQGCAGLVLLPQLQLPRKRISAFQVSSFRERPCKQQTSKGGVNPEEILSVLVIPAFAPEKWLTLKQGCAASDRPHTDHHGPTKGTMAS